MYAESDKLPGASRRFAGVITDEDQLLDLKLLQGERVKRQGYGRYSSSFAGYQPSPPDIHAERKRRGVNPLDQSKYILAVRKALST